MTASPTMPPSSQPRAERPQSSSSMARVSVLYQDDPTRATVADAATLLALFYAPSVLREDREYLLNSARQILGDFEAIDSNRLSAPTLSQADWVEPASSFDLADVAGVLAGAVLQDDTRTDEEILTAAVRVLMGDGRSRSVRVVPGIAFPGQPGQPEGPGVFVVNNALAGTDGLQAIDALPGTILRGQPLALPRNTVVAFKDAPRANNALTIRFSPRLVVNGEESAPVSYSASELGCDERGLCTLPAIRSIFPPEAIAEPGDYVVSYVFTDADRDETQIRRVLTVVPFVFEPNPIVVEDGCTLVDAIAAANADVPVGDCPAGRGGDVIQLTEDVVLTAASSTPDGPTGLTVSSPIFLDGNGQTVRRAETSDEFRLVRVTSTGRLTLTQIVLQDGAAVGVEDAGNGGGIFNNGGELTLALGAVVTQNSAGHEGGGIYSRGGVISVSAGAVNSGNLADGRASNLVVDGSVVRDE